MDEAKNPVWGSCEGPPRDRANGRRVMFWSIGWAASMLFSSAAVSFDWFGGGAESLIAAGISTLIGLGTVGAYRRFLSETDELRQRIELEALALAFGVGIVGGLAYSQVSQSLDWGEPRFAFVMSAMLFVYCAGVILGRRRYA